MNGKRLAFATLVVAVVVAAAGGATNSISQTHDAPGGRQGPTPAGGRSGAISAAQVMRQSYARLFEPPLLPDGLPNPRHLSNAAYLALALGLEIPG